MLVEPLRHISAVPGFGAVIFRRTCPQITNEGGLWSEAGQIYPALGGVARVGDLEWVFPPHGNRISFRHLQHEQDKHGWQGAQIPLIEFDELTHFTEGQFFYLLSRNRSLCGVRPYIRGSCNPDPHSWVKRFLAPWLDLAHAFAAASGELRWLIRDGGHILWHRTRDEVPEAQRADAKSVTFVRASIHDNQIGMRKDPGYLGNLKALNPIDRARLLDGDWDAVADGNLFKRAWFPILKPAEVPPCEQWVRHWDLAATPESADNGDPDWTAGCLMGRTEDNRFVVLDVRRLRGTPAEVEQLIRRTAIEDRRRFGEGLETTIEQEPGSAGVAVTHHYVTRVLVGFAAFGVRSTGSKVDRAKPLSAQAQANTIPLAAGPWNDDFINELVAFPTDGVHDDQVDAASGSFNRLNETYSAGAY